jgi:hypothetical protein
MVSVLIIAITAASSKIQSIIGITKIAISKINIIKALIPRNYSLRIKQFYVGFNNYIKYNNLLLNISNIILETIISFISDKIQSL